MEKTSTSIAKTARQTTETVFTARYAETDQMGIVHHSNYAIWFEAGRMDWLREAGAGNSEIERNGVILPLYEMNCKFIRPALYEDRILVETTAESITRTRAVFSYEVFTERPDPSGKRQLLAIGRTAHAWTSKSLKPVNAARSIPEMLEKLTRACGAESVHERHDTEGIQF